MWSKHAAGKDGVFESRFTVAKLEGYKDHGLEKGSQHLFSYMLAHTEIFILMFFFLFLGLSPTKNSNLNIFLSSQLDYGSSRDGKQ